MTKASAVLHLLVIAGGLIITSYTNNPWWMVGGLVLFGLMLSAAEKVDCRDIRRWRVGEAVCRIHNRRPVQINRQVLNTMGSNLQRDRFGISFAVQDKQDRHVRCTWHEDGLHVVTQDYSLVLPWEQLREISGIHPVQPDVVEALREWAKAYPLKAFPEPDLKRAAEVLEANGMTLDSISASNIRHVLNEVIRIVDEVPQAPQGG